MCTYFDKCVEKLKDVDNTDKRHGLVDLAIAELHYIDKKRLKQLFKFVTNNLEVNVIFQVCNSICSYFDSSLIVPNLYTFDI